VKVQSAVPAKYLPDGADVADWRVNRREQFLAAMRSWVADVLAVLTTENRVQPEPGGLNAGAEAGQEPPNPVQADPQDPKAPECASE